MKLYKTVRLNIITLSLRIYKLISLNFFNKFNTLSLVSRIHIRWFHLVYEAYIYVQ